MNRPLRIAELAVCLATSVLLAPAQVPSAGAPPDPSPSPSEVYAAPAAPDIPRRRFALRDFGASETSDNTAVFRRAVEAVRSAGGGTLEVGPGTYPTGPFSLCSNLELRLEPGARILFTPEFNAYRGGGPKGFRPMIQIDDAHDVLISGSGSIDGNGAAWWPGALRFKAEANARHASSNTSPRPIMIAFTRCTRIRVEGVTLTQAAVLNLTQNACQDVAVVGVNVLNPADSPNTDGIDPKSCRRVLIDRCRIDTGDDCIALGAGEGQLEQDVLVTDCTFLHGHGCSIGSGTSGGVRHVLVRRCSFDGTDTGVRLKSSRGRGGLVEDVIYEDLTMRRVGVAVSINSTYENTTIDTLSANRAEPVTALTPRWRGIIVRNVSSVGGRVRAGLIAGLPEMPAEAVTLEHVSLEAPEGLRLANASGITLRNVRISVERGPDVVSDSSVRGLTRAGQP